MARYKNSEKKLMSKTLVIAAPLDDDDFKAKVSQAIEDAKKWLEEDIL